MRRITIVFIIGFLPSLNEQSAQPPAQPERHSLYSLCTALSKPIQALGNHEVICMGVLDGQKMYYNNSVEKMKIPQCMEKLIPEDDYKKGIQWQENAFKDVLHKLNMMEQNGSDVHVLTRRRGCEVEKQPDGSLIFVRGVDEYGYDGQDFLSFNVTSKQWVALLHEAALSKQKLDGMHTLNQYTKGYLEGECVEWLEKFVTHDNGTACPPEVYVYARTSTDSDNCSITCLATGFHPKEIEMSIRKKGNPVRTAQPSHVRPNCDGTHQARLDADVPKSEANCYDCVVSHSAFKEPVIKNWNKDGTPCDKPPSTAKIVGIAGGVGVLMVAVVGLLIKCVLWWRVRVSSRGVVNRLNVSKALSPTESGKRSTCFGSDNDSESDMDSIL